MQSGDVLNEKKTLKSDLWLDQPDARYAIDARLAKGSISPTHATQLHHFVEKGYLTFQLSLGAGALEQVNRDVDSLWVERPQDLAFAYGGDLASMADAEPARDRQPLYRIADLHSHSPAVRDLYLSSEVFAWLNLIFGQEAVAFQSLYFEFGSRQSLHRDPVYVVTTPPAHLLAVWIALEDIGPDSGPLCYVSGSHRLPYYEFAPGRIAIQPGEDYEPAYEFTRRRIEKAGLQEEMFTGPIGTAFLWHASLVHGGSVPNDSAQTRKSLVVHYSTRKNYQERTASFQKTNVRGQVQRYTQSTAVLIEQDGNFGFENPLLGFEPTVTSRLSSYWQRFRRVFGDNSPW